MTGMPSDRPNLVPLRVQLIPRHGPGISPEDWAARAARIGTALAEDEFPADQLPETLRELTLRDEAGWSWCYDGATWWVWDGAEWVQRLPSGTLQLQPFTMETLVEPAVPSRPEPRPYAPTHRVPDAGMAAWSQPDPSLHPEHSLAAGLDLMVVEQRADGWARVVFSNEWEAWVDGRLLVAVAS